MCIYITATFLENKFKVFVATEDLLNSPCTKQVLCMFIHNINLNFDFSLTGSVAAEAIFNFCNRFLLLRNTKWVDASVHDPAVDFIIARSFLTDLCPSC